MISRGVNSSGVNSRNARRCGERVLLAITSRVEKNACLFSPTLMVFFFNED